MKPFTRASLHVTRHHFPVAHLIAVTIPRFRIILIFIFVALHRRPFVLIIRRSCRRRELSSKPRAFLVGAFDRGFDGA